TIELGQRRVVLGLALHRQARHLLGGGGHRPAAIMAARHTLEAGDPPTQVADLIAGAKHRRGSPVRRGDQLARAERPRPITARRMAWQAATSRPTLRTLFHTTTLDRRPCLPVRRTRPSPPMTPPAATASRTSPAWPSACAPMCASSVAASPA